MDLSEQIHQLFEDSPEEFTDEHHALFDLFKQKLNTGEVRAAEKVDGQWRVNHWVKRGILLGFRLGSPRDPRRRGAHVSLVHDEAWRICRALIERARVIPDFRGPDSIRLGVPPLYTRFVDVYDALERLAGLIERGEHHDVDSGPLRVT